MKAPISVCIITRDEPLFEKAIASIKDYVEEIIVVDTGSINRQQSEHAKNFIYTGCNDPETGLINDFSDARAFSFRQATQPWVMWMDSDDEIHNGEQLAAVVQEGERIKAQGQEVGFLLPYEYAYDDKGNCTLRHYRERLFSNKDKFKWVNPCHEVMIPKEGVPTCLVMRNDVVWKHMRQFRVKPNAEGTRNLRILRRYVAVNGTDDARIMFYLGTEEINNNLFAEGVATLQKYIDKSGWDHEQFMACEKLMNVFLLQGLTKPDNKKENLLAALSWAFKALERREDWGEAYFNIAKCYFHLANLGWEQQRCWQKCVVYAKRGLELPPTQTVLFINPMEREYEIYKYLSLAQNSLGMVEDALVSVEKGLARMPTDTNLEFNKGIFEGFIARKRATESLNKLRELARKDVRFSRVDDYGKSIAEAIINDSHVPHAPPAITAAAPQEKKKLSIVFACGGAWERWNPEQMAQNGIGGSETAVVEMAKRLASKGHSVSVYGNPGPQRIYDGVEYIPFAKWDGVHCDVLVAWRNAEFLETKPRQNAAAIKLLWVHDVYALGMTHKRGLEADRVLALSEWHRQLLISSHQLHPDHVHKTRNGVDLTRFSRLHGPTGARGNVVRDPYKAVCSSSLDRYASSLFKMWPRIKKLVPEATLHVFYGFNTWEAMARMNNDEKQLQYIKYLKDVMTSLEPMGVQFRGRVNQQELAYEFMTAGVWTYPTWWSETSCISAMEAQAAGCFPVTSPIAALNETVGNRGTLISGDWMSDDYADRFVTAVVDRMQNCRLEERDSLKHYAQQNFGWDGVVSEWESLMYNLIDERQRGVMPAYRGIL